MTISELYKLAREKAGVTEEEVKGYSLRIILCDNKGWSWTYGVDVEDLYCDISSCKGLKDFWREVERTGCDDEGYCDPSRKFTYALYFENDDESIGVDSYDVDPEFYETES